LVLITFPSEGSAGAQGGQGRFLLDSVAQDTAEDTFRFAAAAASRQLFQSVQLPIRSNFEPSETGADVRSHLRVDRRRAGQCCPWREVRHYTKSTSVGAQLSYGRTLRPVIMRFFH
jgi:hypothetical protein